MFVSVALLPILVFTGPVMTGIVAGTTAVIVLFVLFIALNRAQGDNCAAGAGCRVPPAHAAAQSYTGVNTAVAPQWMSVTRASAGWPATVVAMIPAAPLPDEAPAGRQTAPRSVLRQRRRLSAPARRVVNRGRHGQ